jgi:hypothetical protein
MKGGSMKLYYLKRECEYDEPCAYVIRAQSPKHARKIASEDYTEYGWDKEQAVDWLNPSLTTCKVLKTEGKPGIIIQDFYEA